jgi:hypothetical protein
MSAVVSPDNEPSTQEDKNRKTRTSIFENSEMVRIERQHHISATTLELRRRQMESGG